MVNPPPVAPLANGVPTSSSAHRPPMWVVFRTDARMAQHGGTSEAALSRRGEETAREQGL